MHAKLLSKSYRSLMCDEYEEYRERIAFLTGALIGDATNGHAYNNRGVAYWEIGEIEQAQADFAQAALVDETNPTPCVNLGDLLSESQNAAAALPHYDAAISRDDADVSLYRSRASARQTVGDHSLAIDDFTTAIRLAPKFRQTYTDRAKSYAALGEKEKAKEDRATAKTLKKK